MPTQTARLSAPASTSELNRLLVGDHHDPHQLLGRHGDQVVAYRPDARAMYLLLPSGEEVEMTRIRDEGLFAAEAPGAEAGYRLRAEYPDDDTDEFVDPYRFLPTVGEQDLYLFGEGRHRRLWEMLGAHVGRHDGVTGTSFAVWAPNARSVRVVGDFNYWDGRLHAMRSVGSSGVWEIFLPGVDAGARYKYEILSPAGHLTLKADPMAYATDPPPATDSVVTRSEHH